MSLYTPAARQPSFGCPHCFCRVFDRAALKNHIRAIHPLASPHHVRRFQSPAAYEPSTPQRSSNEEPIPIPGTASPAITENKILWQQHLPDYDDHDYDEDNIPYSDRGGSMSHSSTPICVPSSPSHGHMMHAHADDKYTRKIYHPTLNSKGLLII